MSDLTLAIEIQMQAQQAMNQVQALAGTISQMGRSLEDTGSKSNAAGESMFTSMIKAQVVMEGVHKAMDAIRTLFVGVIEKGIEFNSVMAGSSLGVSALIATQMDLKDANGQALTGQAALSASMDLGTKQMNDLRLGSFKTIATVQELSAAYQQGLGPMLAAGIGLEDTTKLTVKMAQAAGALNLDIATLGHEIRTTFNGEISPRMAKIASSLHISNEDISNWKQAGTLVEEMNKRLEMFSLAGDQVEKSWRGVTSNLRHAAEAGAGEMVMPLFDALRASLFEALKEVFDTSTGNFAEAFQGILDVAKDTFGALGDVAAKGIQLALGTLEAFSTWLGDNREELKGFMSVAGNVASVVGAVLGGAFSLVADIVGGFITTVGKFPVLFTAVLGAVAAMSLGLILDSVAWNALAISIIDAAFAVQAFLVSIGPLGWTVGVVGALVGAVTAMTGATEKAAKAEQENASALMKSNESANILNDRYQTLTKRIQDNTLSLGGRLQAEKEMREVLEKLKRAGDDYLEGLRLEKMTLEQLAVVIQTVTDKRNQDSESKRKAAVAQKAATEASLIEAKAALAKLYTRSVPTDGRGQAALATAQFTGETKVKELGVELERLRTLVQTYGGEEAKVNLTLDQRKERLAELRVEIARLNKAQDVAWKAAGGAEATAAYEKRAKELVDLNKEFEELSKKTPGTASARPVKPDADGKSKALKDLELEIALGEQALKGMQHETLEQQEQAQLAQISLQAQKDRAKVMAETEKTDKDKLSPGAAAQRRKAITDAEIAQELAVVSEGYVKRKAMEEALEEGLTSQEEGGLAKRLAAIEKQFVKLRQLNTTLGGPKSSDDLAAAQSAANERARQDQVKTDLAKLKQELAELGQTRGPLTNGEISEKLDEFKKKSKEAAEAVLRLSAEMHLNDTAGHGWAMGMKSYLAETGNAFNTWKNAALTVMKGVETATATAYARIIQHGSTASQKWDALWKGMSGAVIGAVTQIMAQQTVKWVAEKAMAVWDDTEFAKRRAKDAAEVAAQTAKTAKATSGATAEKIAIGATTVAISTQAAALGALTTATAAQVPASAAIVSGLGAEVVAMDLATIATINLAAAEIWAAMILPPLAIAATSAMMIDLAAVDAAAVGVTAFAVGGVIDRPTLALMGEAGTEVLAPESSFQDYTKDVFSMGANLASNLAGHDRQVMGYQAAGADSYGSLLGSGSQGSAGGRNGGEVHNYAGALIVATNSRQWEDMVAMGNRGYQKRKN